MYLRPRRLDEALAALQERPRPILAGGTDFYPARVGRPPEDDVLDLTAVAELRGIERTPEGVRIGATTTWSEILDAPLPASLAALKLAAREVGGVQIQNAGTVAGNLCNASPAADGIPVLLALGARVELRSAAGRRVLPIGEFVLGSQRTALRPDEIVIAIDIPPWAEGARSTFLKLGARRYLVISIAMVAAVVEPDESRRVGRAAIAVGACSPVARRLPALEAALVGRPCDVALGAAVEARHLALLAPITDVRGTAEYRRDAVMTLVRRAIETAAA